MNTPVQMEEVFEELSLRIGIADSDHSQKKKKCTLYSQGYITQVENYCLKI